MIDRFENIKDFLKELQHSVKNNANIYIIGGAALLARGMKPATKDIDMVVESKKEFEEINNALRNAGFKAKKISALYERFDLAYQLVRDDFQVDLFHKAVCSQFALSKKMIERAEKTLVIGKIKIFFCSNEDIFLFKTMTEREGDLIDCIELVKRGLDWKAILEEMNYQIKNHGRDVWITWIGERLDLLEEKGVNIPIMKEIDTLREKYFTELEKRLQHER